MFSCADLLDKIDDYIKFFVPKNIRRRKRCYWKPKGIQFVAEELCNIVPDLADLIPLVNEIFAVIEKEESTNEIPWQRVQAYEEAFNAFPGDEFLEENEYAQWEVILKIIELKTFLFNCWNGKTKGHELPPS